MKNMRKTLLALGMVVGLMVIMSSVSQATEIKGILSVTAFGTLDKSTISASTTISSITASIDFPPSSGDYAGANNFIFKTPIVFSPPTSSINSFLTFSVGGVAYQFDVISMVTSYNDNGTSVTFTGLGNMSRNSGQDLTKSDYSITIQKLSAKSPPQIIVEIDSPAVPEPSTLLLFGVGLLGLGFAGRGKRQRRLKR